MLKKSTLFSVSIFFLLFIGLSDYGYGCHKGGNDTKGCDPPQGGEDAKSSVTIQMDGGGLEGASNTDTPWVEGNRRLIGQNNSVNDPDWVGGDESGLSRGSVQRA